MFGVKLLFIASRYTGGNGGHARRTAERLAGRGFEVKLMHAPTIQAPGLRNPSFALTAAVKAALGRERFDAVHAFNIPTALAMRCAHAKKRVLSMYGRYAENMRMIRPRPFPTLARWAEPVTFRWADRLVTDSRSVQEWYRDGLGADFECLYVPLNTDEFATLPDVPVREGQVAYVGRDSRDKGIDVLREAEPLIEGSVTYCTNVGWREAMVRIKESELLVLPSRMESMPTVVKEAFYLGKPVVATDVNGVPEVVTHNESGLLVRPGDPAGLADAVNSLLADRQRAERMGRRGREFVERNMTWDALLPQYVRFYEGL